MSTDNPLLHPDILPVILSFCPDRTLAALMRCSRSHLAAVVSLRYPYIELDPGAAPRSRPNTIRQDLPTDAKWFSQAFAAYISRFAKAVFVGDHGSWMCPPRGMMLGCQADNIQVRSLAEGGKVVKCPDDRDRADEYGERMRDSVEVRCLRLRLPGVCQPESGRCSILQFFRPGTLVVVAFFGLSTPHHAKSMASPARDAVEQLHVASSVYISSTTRQLVVEIDLWRNNDDNAARLPDGIDLCSRLPSHLEEVVVLILPASLNLKRAEKPAYTTLVRALAGLAVALENVSGDKVDVELGAAGEEETMSVDDPTQSGTAGRNQGGSVTLTLVGLGQLNPSWAGKKVWDEDRLEELILADIHHCVHGMQRGHAAIGMRRSPPQLDEPRNAMIFNDTQSTSNNTVNYAADPDTSTAASSGILIRTVPILKYLNSPATRSQTTPEFWASHVRGATRQGQAIRAAARKVAMRDAQDMDAKRRKMGGGQSVEGGGEAAGDGNGATGGEGLGDGATTGGGQQGPVQGQWQGAGMGQEAGGNAGQAGSGVGGQAQTGGW